MRLCPEACRLARFVGTTEKRPTSATPGTKQTGNSEGPAPRSRASEVEQGACVAKHVGKSRARASCARAVKAYVR